MIGQSFRSMKSWFVLLIPLAFSGGFALGWMTARPRISTARAPSAPEAPLIPAPPLKSESETSGVSLPASSPVRRAALIVKAFGAAQTDLAAALRLLEGVEDSGERRAILEGVFGWLAEARPPSEALEQALALGQTDRHGALRALAGAWLGMGKGGLSAEWLMVDKRGFIAAAAEMLSGSQNVPPGAAKAWVEAFANHPGRAAIAGSYAAAQIAQNPAEALALARDFTPWERQQFFNAAIPQWAAKDPAAALTWFRAQSEPLPASLRSRIFEAWAEANSGSARAQLSALTDPSEQLELTRALGRAMAQEGTREAVAWADTLPEPAVRDAAHEAIYEATPRGIGALMAYQEGFPTVNGVLPNSVAQQAGLQTGDRLVEIAGASGDFTPLYGRGLEEAIGQIRGEPGQTARLRILRNGPDGRPAEQVLELTREQIVLPPAKTGRPD
jgi:hypothetical protein